MEIYLIRHTKIEIEKGICYGQTDLPLADSFPEEFEKLKSKLPERFDAVFTSPAQRCWKLAERLRTNVYKKDDRLKELNFGIWEMKKWTDMEQHGLQGWMKDFVRTRAPQGESYEDLFARSTAFIEEVLALPAEKVAVVTHAGVMRGIISYLIGLPLENSFQLHFDFGGATLFRINGVEKKLIYHNF